MVGKKKHDAGAEAPAASIRALAVDDNLSMARLIANCLDVVPRLTVVGIALSGESALEQAESLVPDLVVTDLAMAGINGLRLTRLLRRRLPAVRVIITSVHEGAPWRDLSLQSGADAFISKSSLAEELPRAVERIFAGRGMESQKKEISVAIEPPGTH